VIGNKTKHILCIDRVQKSAHREKYHFGNKNQA